LDGPVRRVLNTDMTRPEPMPAGTLGRVFTASDWSEIIDLSNRSDGSQAEYERSGIKNNRVR